MSRLILAAVVAAGSFALAPQISEAGCGGGFRGGYGGGFGGGWGGGYGHRTTYTRNHYTPIYRTPVVHRPIIVHKPVAPIVVHKPVVVAKPVVIQQPVVAAPVAVAPIADPCFHPQHCHTWVLPGESLDAICLREYGDASLWRRVASYNSCTTLAVGQKLLLPSIYQSGRMIPSTAPSPTAPAAAPIAVPPVAALAAPPVAPGA